jgi:hypothetical protein
MLRINRVGSYAIPRYPQGVFKPWREPAAVTLMKRGVVSAALLAILESCDEDGGGGTGITGPPPLVPQFLTENEARVIITNVFTDNGITLTPDVTLSIAGSHGDTTEVVLDGYNDSLRVGYEYVTPSDKVSFTSEVIARIRADATDSGPYITITGQQNYAGYLEFLMQEFIDTLKAHGKI